MRLHIRELRAKQLAPAVDRQLLRLVHLFTTAVPAFSRVALGIFVRETRALSSLHSATAEVFARDQLDVVLLTGFLSENDVGDGRITGADNVGHDIVQRVHLSDAPCMPSACEGGFQESVDDLLRGVARILRAAQAEYVCVI